MIPAAKVLYASRGHLLSFLRDLPRLFLTEAWYLMTGIDPDMLELFDAMQRPHGSHVRSLSAWQDLYTTVYVARQSTSR